MTRKRKRKSRAWIWGMLTGVVLVAAAIAILAQSSAPTAAPVPTATPALEIDPNAGAQVTPTPAPTEPGVAIPGWGSITLPAGQTTAATILNNPQQNEGWYHLTFRLSLKDSGEVIFTTGLIPPGQYCNEVTLSRPLEPGEYAAVLHVQPYRISDQSPTNNADMETVLIVQ